MAVVEETIGSGKDRATVTLWEANVGSFGTDIYKGIIQESAEFNENVTLNGGAGTPSITSYLWLTTDPANLHAGVAGTGHGRMRGSTGGSHVLNVDAAFTRIDWLEIQQDSTGSSDEGIRVLVGADDVLVDYCIVWDDQTASSRDGVYVGDWAIANLRVSNTIIYGFTRAGIHLQQFGSTGRTITADIDHCSIYDCGSDASNEVGALFVQSSGASDSITVSLRNTWGDLFGTTEEAFADGGDTGARGVPDGTVVWNGSHNLATVYATHDQIDGTDNLTNWQHATTLPYVEDTTQPSGNYVVVTSKTAGSEDLTLLDAAAGNLAAGNGTDRQGSEPDARQDFSVAIDGARLTTNVDIGASQFSGVSVSLFATADGTIVDVVNEADAASPLWSSVDDDPNSPTDTDWVNNAITPGTVRFFPLLTDVPGDFGTADAATIVARYRGVNFGAGSLTLYIQLYQSDESTPLSDEVAVVTVSANGSFANTSLVTITGIVAGSKAIWDGVRARVRWSLT